jgi:hypothetical protein
LSSNTARIGELEPKCNSQAGDLWVEELGRFLPFLELEILHPQVARAFDSQSLRAAQQRRGKWK